MVRFSTVAGFHLSARALVIMAGAVALALTGVAGVCDAYYAPEIQLNSTTQGNQTEAAVGVAPTGLKLAVWVSKNEGQNEWWVRGRFFDPLDAPLGPDFTVSDSYPQYGVASPRVLPLSNGELLVIWTEESGSRLAVRRYLADGNPAGPAVTLIDYYTHAHWGWFLSPRAAVNSAGQILLVWKHGDELYDFPTSQIFTYVDAQLFDSDLSPVGARFTIAWAETTPEVVAAEVAFSSAGEFVVTRSFPSPYQILGQRRSALDGSLIAEFPVADLYGGHSYDEQGHALLASPSGLLMVVWQDPQLEIGARILAADGSPVTAPITVEYSMWNGQPAVAEFDGTLLLVWNHTIQGGGSDIHARRMAWTGELLSDVEVLNTLTAGAQSLPAAAPGLVSWESTQSPGSDTSGMCVLACFVYHIFADGFESSLTSAWSLTVP